MKYNPKINEVTARLAGFTGLHPLPAGGARAGRPGAAVRARRVAGRDRRSGAPPRCSPRPARTASSPGCCSCAPITCARAATPRRRSSSRTRRTAPIPPAWPWPATARGREERRARQRGYGRARGRRWTSDVAALMLTNPNTLGLFDEHIVEIARLVHEAGGLLYYDGANANAVLGVVAARRHGLRHRALQHAQDVQPRRTAAAARAPAPSWCATCSSRSCPAAGGADDDGRYYLDDDRPDPSARCAPSTATSACWCAPTTYILALGAGGPRRVSETAVLNANYVMAGRA